MSATESTADYSKYNDGDAFRASLSDIVPLPFGNVRTERDPDAFSSLREAIKAANGVTQSVTVRINPDNSSQLQLIAGYGRFEASNLEGFNNIPVVFKEANDKEALAMMLSENTARESLHVVDEARSAQSYISLHDGDYDEAARCLGWSKKKLEARLLLNNCSDAVLDACRKNEIKLGHAEILSSYTEEKQNNTLKVIIAEDWSVEYLKERANRQTKRLATAIFDLKDCNTCAYNTDVQASLFENTLGRAKCSNLPCYRDKTNEAIEAKKEELSGSFALVLTALEKPESDRQTVSADDVGKKQFESGCTGCTSNAVVIQCGINEDAGDVFENQCVDSDCFRKLVAKHKADSQPKPKPTKSSNTSTATAKKATAKKSAKTVTQKTPAAVVANHKRFIHTLSADYFSNDIHLRECMSVGHLIHGLGHLKSKITKADSLQNIVMELYKLDDIKLEEIKQKTFDVFIGLDNTSVGNIESLMINAFAKDDRGESLAVRKWKPTNELLQCYLISSLNDIAKKSGLRAHYEKEHGKGSFAKATKKKDDLIKVLLETEFDWSDYAPDDLVKTLHNK